VSNNRQSCLAFFRKSQNEFVCRSMCTFTDLSLVNCCYMFNHAVELPMWMHSVANVQEASVQDGLMTYHWYMRPGFPYGGATLAMHHTGFESAGGSADPITSSLVKNDNIPEDPGSLLASPRMVMSFSVGPRPSDVTVLMVNRLELRNVPSRAPPNISSRFLQTYAAYSAQVAMKRLQTRARLLVAGVAGANASMGSHMGGVHVEDNVPCFPLMDELLARSIPFTVATSDNMPSSQRWDAVEELATATQDLLASMGCTQVDDLQNCSLNSSVSTGVLQSLMDTLWSHCKRMQNPMLPRQLGGNNIGGHQQPEMTVLLVVDNPSAMLNEVQQLEACQYKVTLCSFSIAQMMLQNAANKQMFNIVLVESIYEQENQTCPQTVNVLNLCKLGNNSAQLPAVVISKHLSKTQLAMYMNVGAVTFLLMPFTVNVDVTLRQYALLPNTSSSLNLMHPTGAYSEPMTPVTNMPSPSMPVLSPAITRNSRGYINEIEAATAKLLGNDAAAEMGSDIQMANQGPQIFAPPADINDGGTQYVGMHGNQSTLTPPSSAHFSKFETQSLTSSSNNKNNLANDPDSISSYLKADDDMMDDGNSQAGLNNIGRSSPNPNMLRQSPNHTNQHNM